MAVVLWGRDKLSQIEFAFLMQLVIGFQVCPAQISHPDAPFVVHLGEEKAGGAKAAVHSWFGLGVQFADCLGRSADPTGKPWGIELTCG